jgi:hypothetical protein
MSSVGVMSVLENRSFDLQPGLPGVATFLSLALHD